MVWDPFTTLEDKDHVSASEERVVELSNDEPIVKKGENHKKGTNYVLVRRRKS